MGCWSVVTLANTFPVSVFLSSLVQARGQTLHLYPQGKTQDSGGGRGPGIERTQAYLMKPSFQWVNSSGDSPFGGSAPGFCFLDLSAGDPWRNAHCLYSCRNEGNRPFQVGSSTPLATSFTQMVASGSNKGKLVMDLEVSWVSRRV